MGSNHHLHTAGCTAVGLAALGLSYGILVNFLPVGLLGAISVAAQQVNWRTDFFEVAMGTPERVWLFDGSQMLHTSDGGQTWIVQRSSKSPGASGRSLVQIQFLDAQTGWVLFDKSLLHRTIDAGRTWQAIDVRPKRPNETAIAFLKRIHMVSPLVGFGLNDDGDLLLRTADGGLTWRTSEIKQGHPFFLRLSFFDEKRGWVSADRGLLATTNNGGQTWETLPPAPANGASQIQFRSADIGWFLEADTLRLYRTADGGHSWQVCGAVPNNAEINGFFFLTPTLGWAASDSGVVLRTTDGCASWQAIQTPIDKHLQAVHFVDARNGWAVGNEDGVVKSADGGLTWTQVTVNVP